MRDSLIRPTLSNTDKPYDRAKPLHRIHCPDDVWGGTRPEGNELMSGYGFESGCRGLKEDESPMTAGQFFEDLSEGALVGLLGGVLFGLVGAGLGALTGTIVGAAKGEDLEDWAQDGAIWGAGLGALAGFVTGICVWFWVKDEAAKQLLATIPGWVHVENTRSMTQPVDAELERELEGPLGESRLSRTDVPLYQYHRYFDWCFFVTPSPDYLYITGDGNKDEDEEVPAVECEWDTGAFASASPTSDGAIYTGLDLGWPVDNQYLWLAGRWIYDCGHPIDNPTEQSDPKKARLMKTELHPVKAFASARWQGVQFSRNRDKYVPGIRFTFFASRKGGYLDFKDLCGKDYEFIVDLPKHPSHDAMDYTVVPSKDYPESKTIKARARGRHAVPPPGEGDARVHARETELLINMSSQAFDNPGFGKLANVTPTVEPIEPEGSTEVPTQLKVKIPLSQASPDDDCYGVHIELGWLDDANWNLAQQVREFSVTFHSVTAITASHGGDWEFEGANEEWRLRYGVNGRWLQTPETTVGKGGHISLGDKKLTVYLADEDELRVYIHGTEHDLVEDIFRKSDDDRTVKLDGKAIDYQEDIVKGDAAHRRRIAREIFSMMLHTLKDQCEALGYISKGFRAADLETHRPVKKQETGLAKVKDKNPPEARTEPASRGDYELSFTIEVREQDL